MTPPPAAQAAPQTGLLGRAERPRRFTARLAWYLADADSAARIRLVLDAFVLYLAAALALFADPTVRDVTSDRWLAISFPIAVTALMRARRSPDERLHVSMLDTFIYLLGVVSLVAMLAVSVDSILGGSDPLAFAPRLWLFSVVYLGTARVALVSARQQARATGAFGSPTLIVGAGLIGGHLVKRLAGEPGYGLRPVGFVDDDPLPTAPVSSRHSLPVLGGLDDLFDVIARTGARHVILAFSGERDQVLVERVRQLEGSGIGVSLVPRLYETINERTTLDHLGGLPLLTLHATDPRGWQFAVKHALDRTVALIGLLIASPVMVTVAIAVRVSSSGPILFRQRRVGRDGREFDLLKFRTMRMPDDDVRAFNLPEGVAPGGVEGSDRRTRVGRLLRDLSLDELPQLINVLRGDMSLVGPRPERPEYVARFARDVARYDDRHRVRSGITGWAQVNGLRGQTSIADRVEWDNYYIQNWSLRLDVRIALLTIAEVLRSRDSRTSLPDDPTLPHTARHRRNL
ncbi:MAG: exopolysaccharide biosynthesis polyprenyl glycosylphosphotransferase [Solirubrobacterales bacterium]|nr:exopolysaccharide biosynthesis polyprenyl glycosylphosphotransferase [Solirubrobacterales bacterium]